VDHPARSNVARCRVRDIEKPEFQKAMTGYTEMWVTGKREILRVVD
jgi:hypothetical protein